MLMAGISARHWNGGTVPLRRMRAHLWGRSPAQLPKRLEVAGTCLCGDQALGFWFAVLAPLRVPYFPAATRLSVGTGERPPTHTPTSSLCRASKPRADGCHFQTLLQGFLLPFKFRPISSLFKISFSTFSLSCLLACAGERRKRRKVREKPGFPHRPSWMKMSPQAAG